MGRHVNEARITTKAARAKLAPSKAPYWREIDRGAHIGYRKGKKGGTWIARHRKPDGKYTTKRIGKADDALEADGEVVLDYSQALNKARAWIQNQILQDTGRHRGDYTVKGAIADYLDWYARHRKAFSHTYNRAHFDIIPKLGSIKVEKLDSATIRKWHENMASAPRSVRGKRGKPARLLEKPATPEDHRKRRATANKALTVLKSALNQAYRDGKVNSDDAWRRVKPFHNVDAASIRYLANDECVRLINACKPDFRRLVMAALFSGCRYGELAALKCGDFNHDTGSVFIRDSKSGRPRHANLSEEGVTFFSQAVLGRPTDALMFTHEDGEPWGTGHPQRRIKAACERAAISPAISFHVLRHTHGSQLAMNGVPVAVIAAQLGHSDTRITEKHYAHLSPSYVAHTIRSNLPELGVVQADSNVEQLGQRRAG